MESYTLNDTEGVEWCYSFLKNIASSEMIFLLNKHISKKNILKFSTSSFLLNAFFPSGVFVIHAAVLQISDETLKNAIYLSDWNYKQNSVTEKMLIFF